LFKYIQLLAISALIFSGAPSKALTINKIAPDVTISGDNGGYIADGSTFKVTDLKGKLNVIWYVDPDERDLNKIATEALRSAKFPPETVGSVAIINFDATIIPNFILGGIIEDSQEKNKETIYIKDLEKVLVKKWKLKDDSSNVIVLSKDLKVLYWFGGQLGNNDIKTMLETIKNNM
jgi:uncharacterized protein